MIELSAVDTTVETRRLTLVPLLPEHAAELFPILSAKALYEYTHDQPPSSLDALRDKYAFLASRRSPDGEQVWLNWILREVTSGQAIGYVQATVIATEADLAWVIGAPWQGHGYATEAARAMLVTLRSAGIQVFRAKINPIHRASQRVAVKLGLARTGEKAEGEEVWMTRV